MESNKFSEILNAAIGGNKDAIDAVITRYMPLINKQSMVNRVFDEDLKQYIILRILEQLPRFNPERAK